MNADNFTEAYLLYDYELRRIMEFIFFCYENMLIKYDNQTIENNENKIRNRLYKDFLSSNLYRSRFDLFPCRFECESAEINSLYEEEGYTDIKVLTTTSLIESEAYYIIECKRLDGGSFLNRQYVQEGVFRFIDIKYPSYKNIGGMIGFIVKYIDIEKNVKKISNILGKKDRSLLNFHFIENNIKSKNKYISVHKNPSKGNISIYHLMLDMSKIIDN